MTECYLGTGSIFVIFVLSIHRDEGSLLLLLLLLFLLIKTLRTFIDAPKSHTFTEKVTRAFCAFLVSQKIK